MANRKALTPDLKQEVCLRIAEGETVRQIGASEHMPATSTIYLALANDAEFAENYARAREAQLVRWEDELLEIADDASKDFTVRKNDSGEEVTVVDHEHIARSKVRIDTRKWLMSKRAPKKYGDRVDVNHGAQDGLGDLLREIDGSTRGLPGHPRPTQPLALADRQSLPHHGQERAEAPLSDELGARGLVQ